MVVFGHCESNNDHYPIPPPSLLRIAIYRISVRIASHLSLAALLHDWMFLLLQVFQVFFTRHVLASIVNIQDQASEICKQNYSDHCRFLYFGRGVMLRKKASNCLPGFSNSSKKSQFDIAIRQQTLIPLSPAQ